MQNRRPQTIQIFLPDGDPRGIRIAELTTRIVQVIEIPRSLLSAFLKMPESKHVAVYFLVGQNTDTEDAQIYVGQSSELQVRFGSHNREKDFWEKALVLISKTHSLTQTHALFLEWHCLQEAKKAARYTANNGNNASRPHTPAPLEADCHEIFDTARTLLSSLGHPLFEPVVRLDVSRDDAELFYCRSSNADGRGYYTEEGFVLLEGSSGRRDNVASIHGTSEERFREGLIESGVFRVEADRIVLEKDHLFNSPSRAAAALMGRTANGWIEWKNSEGKTLDALKRQSPRD